MLVKLSWAFQNQNLSKIVDMIGEDDEDFHFDGQLITTDVLEEFKKDGYLIFRDLEDGTFNFLHVNLVKDVKVL